MKVKIYAPDWRAAAMLAADMNLALRHWEWASESTFSRLDTWADVGSVMDHLEKLEWHLKGLDK